MHRFVVAALWIAILAVPCTGLRARTHDFDGDGRGDLVWRSTVSGENVIWRSALVSTPLQVAAMTDARWRIAGVGDFDGDTRADLLWRNAVTGGDVIWRDANANTMQVVATVADPAWHVAGVGDFDGDGRDDIAWRHLGDGRLSVWPAANMAQARALPAIALPWTIAGVGDLDGDGHDDLIWRHVQSGANVAWRSGDPAQALAITDVSNPEWKIAAVDDFDGNGRADLLWRESFDGRGVIWHGGDSSATTALPEVNATWSIAASGDFDGDGRSDVLWRQFPGGRNVLWRGAESENAQPLSTAAAGAWLAVPYEGERIHPLLFPLPPVVDEGNADHIATWRLVLSHESVQPIDYDIQPDALGTPAEFAAGLGEDYDFAGPTAGRIPIGETAIGIPLMIRGDAYPEANEWFPFLPVFSRNGLLVHAEHGLIRNDDANTVWIENVGTLEGNAGTHAVIVRVLLSRPQSTPVSFDIETRSGGRYGATAGTDYIAKAVSGASIPAGATRFDFVVEIIGDREREPFIETFYVAMTRMSGATLVGASGRVGIRTDDGGVWFP